eukprot:2618969-Prymnesium_polylepis.1
MVSGRTRLGHRVMARVRRATGERNEYRDAERPAVGGRTVLAAFNDARVQIAAGEVEILGCALRRTALGPRGSGVHLGKTRVRKECIELIIEQDVLRLKIAVDDDALAPRHGRVQ